MASHKILIVDDDRDFAESLGELLETQGHQVELAFTGEDGVRLFAEQQFDIAFMDVKLPGKNGVESFLEIRVSKPKAKIVMMTGFSVPELLQQAVDNGAFGVFNKPLDHDKVLALLEKIRPKGIILIADDDPDFIDSVVEVITSAGHTVVIARTGEEAVARVNDNKIDVLVLDLRLPILSGLEVYLELKAVGKTVPTMIVTGYAQEEQSAIDRLGSLSVTGCLIKPFPPEQLLDALESMMKAP